MTCALPPFDEDENCRACGVVAKHISFEFDFSSGHMVSTCSKCRYGWFSRPLFGNTPPILRLREPCESCPACDGSSKEIDVSYLDDRTSSTYQYGWYSGYLREDVTRFLNEAVGGDIADMLPFLGLKCRRCRFVWPEVPLNRDDAPAPVFPTHMCGGGES